MTIYQFSKSAISIALLLAAASPALAAPEEFLNAIGGSATVKGSEKNAPEAIPLVRDAQSVIGARFFYEKISPSFMATADAARAAFDQQCRKDGGSVVPDSDPSVQEFGARFAKVFAGRTPYKNRQANFVAVCATDPNHVIGVMGAIVYDPSDLLTHSSDAGSLMMFSLSPPKVRTAIYAFRPSLVVPPAQAAENAQREMRRQAAAATANQAAYEANQKALADYRKSLQIGAVTNCGMIIDMRGAVAQLQQNGVYSGVTAPTRWVRVDQLLPKGNACPADPVQR